jgi:hypothetical protein
MSAWPFDQPKDCAVFTTTHVMKGGRDILYVFHDEEDHGWQFHYGGKKDAADAMIVALEEIVARDPFVLEVADLPLGWKAWRNDRGARWQRAKSEEL